MAVSRKLVKLTLPIYQLFSGYYSDEVLVQPHMKVLKIFMCTFSVIFHDKSFYQKLLLGMFV
jgi:hypothetical protein